MGTTGIILLIVGGYVLVHLILYFIQDLLFFHPEKLQRNFHFKYDIPFEEIVLDGIDNSVVDALYFSVEGAERVVFYFKGNTRSIKGWAKFAKDFTTKGYHFFIIDYPGFGKSTGRRNEATINNNAQIAYNWLKAKHGEDNIIIYGRSLGAGFASYIAKTNNPLMLILDSPFYCFRELARYYTRVVFIRTILKYDVPLYKYIKDVCCPVFILHGNRDRIIPYRFGKKLEEINPENIKLYTIEGSGHNQLPKHKQYHEILEKLLQHKGRL